MQYNIQVDRENLETEAVFQNILNSFTPTCNELIMVLHSVEKSLTQCTPV